MTSSAAYVIIRETLCTAYKSTVQTEQTVTLVMESGHNVTVGRNIHGTVDANTDFVGVFLYFFSDKPKISPQNGAAELS